MHGLRFTALFLSAVAVGAATPNSGSANPSSTDPSETSSLEASSPDVSKVQGSLPLSALDSSSMVLEDGAMRAHLEDGRVVTFTLHPELQSFIDELFARYRVPAAAAVVLNSRTGRVLALSQQRLQDSAAPTAQVAFDPSPPAASIFKIVTAAALLERGGVSIDTKTCYSGGSSKLLFTHLQKPPPNLSACATLGSALGHSINAIMARLSDQHLSQSILSEYLTRFHFNQPLPFDWEIPVSTGEIPTDRLERARAAAGFWHTHVSPIHAASIAQLVAQGGALLRPYIVESIAEADGSVSYQGEPQFVSRPISKTTASILLKAMTDTVRTGTARKAFRDGQGHSYLPGIEVSGKTGTLTGVDPYRAYTWFVAAAPTSKPEVAIAVLVVNEPRWRIKAATAAALILKKHFELASKE